jgi:nitrous oxide reductase accessory protein NosL
MKNILVTLALIFLCACGASIDDDPQPTTKTSKCPATYNGKTVYEGPKGGCYYYNKNGNKTYI